MISTAKGPSKPLTGPLANAYGSRWASGALLAASGNSIHLHPFGPDATTTQPVINHWQCQLGAEAFLWLDHSSTLQARGVEPPVPSNAVPGQRHNLLNAWIGKLCSCPRPGILSFGYRSQRTSTDTVSILKYVPKRRERSCTHAAPAAAPDSSDISRILTS